MQDRKAILAIEDDPELGSLLKELLETEQFDVTLATSGEDGLRDLQHTAFSAVILDIMLPGIDGLEVLRQIRSTQTTPIMMLTARGEELDRIIGFEMGADDYLPKPFNPRELIARLKALIRRVAMDQKTEASANNGDIQIGDLKITTKSRQVFAHNTLLSLTQVEFELLTILAGQPDEVLHKADLCEQTLHRKLTLYDRAIDVHISNLRKKLSQAGATSPVIHTIRGIGYKLTADNGLRA
ncbi:two component transcriptional regulator, winged helix family [Oleiphilus messinensis]|uniref:Two component transcriptional regulator, winged helix family n=1 Tax=Oleiphilus messinensis TaxID=141451 RepID=A0A1Y0IDE1_9GAMM|nr:response regulator transcription factor [Oleiphilus messinensis]ARU58547.1 two component transcriptional regulator, winged helix family [Oleiphilus messinensis]